MSKDLDTGRHICTGGTYVPFQDGTNVLFQYGTYVLRHICPMLSWHICAEQINSLFLSFKKIAICFRPFSITYLKIF
jgi:hypothetical protein